MDENSLIAIEREKTKRLYTSILLIFIGLFLVSAVVAGIFVANNNYIVTQQTKQKNTEELKQQQEYVKNQKLRESCLTSAYDTYVENWNSTCELNQKSDNCGLPHDLAQSISDRRKLEEDRCYQLYK